MLLFCICLLAITSSGAATWKWEASFDDRVDFLDYCLAISAFGESLESMIQRTNAKAGINCNFFGTCSNGSVFPIGVVKFHMKDLTSCPAPKCRGYIWQAARPGLGFKPPKKAVFVVQGIVLILNGKTVKGNQGLPRSYWKRSCLRSILALNKKANRFYLMRVVGAPRGIGSYLIHQRHMTDTMILDSGSSSQHGALVADGLMVFSKTREFYRLFSQKYFPKKTDWQLLFGKASDNVLLFGQPKPRIFFDPLLSLFSQAKEDD